MTQGLKPCDCGEMWAAHSLADAARLAGITRDAIRKRVLAEGIGTQIGGRWHFRASELHGRQKSGRPRIHPADAGLSDYQRYYRRNTERLRERSRLWNTRRKEQQHGAH